MWRIYLLKFRGYYSVTNDHKNLNLILTQQNYWTFTPLFFISSKKLIYQSFSELRQNNDIVVVVSKTVWYLDMNILGTVWVYSIVFPFVNDQLHKPRNDLYWIPFDTLINIFFYILGCKPIRVWVVFNYTTQICFTTFFIFPCIEFSSHRVNYTKCTCSIHERPVFFVLTLLHW